MPHVQSITYVYTDYGPSSMCHDVGLGIGYAYIDASMVAYQEMWHVQLAVTYCLLHQCLSWALKEAGEGASTMFGMDD